MVSFVEKQREAAKNILTLVERAEQVVIIHYSCESFYDAEDGRTPRITSIACRNFSTGQTRSFSIHQVAELPKFREVDAWESYDEIERELLDQFFVYVGEHSSYVHWVHWNMRDINYGFPAIEHRYEVLGGIPRIIPEDKKHDLARLLVSKYGKRYAGHPRLQSISSLNKITDRDSLSGAEEANAYKEHEFLKLHQSTLRKVDIIASLLEEAGFDRLKTMAPFWDRQGGSLRLIWEKYISKPIVRIIGILLVILGLIEWLFPDAKVAVSKFLWSLI
ncbi:hypothetical protein [uncultured Sulfitobacter sp.]|uniref:hypothetical protein n=1 Tax=uncultured Sulfitobacter sp. TaxID=191468 RepID=UPI0026303B2B|nr:hypothetical protein [uncultured Sulfitobacter sp.]